MNVLEHDDGVVHHEADGHHKRQQRQHVDRQAKRQKHGKGCDQRDRNRDGRDDRRLEVAEEDVDHPDDQHHRDAERYEHLVDCCVDEHGAVKIDP